MSATAQLFKPTQGSPATASLRAMEAVSKIAGVPLKTAHTRASQK